MKITKAKALSYLGRYVWAKFEVFPEGKRIHFSGLFRRRGKLLALLVLSPTHQYRIPWNEVRIETLRRRRA